MPLNKYELRSKDVQEVMKSPPNYLITWGNSVIILILFFSIVITNVFKLPVKLVLPAKIIKIDTLTTDTYNLQLSLGVSIPSSVLLKQKAIIKLDNYIAGNLGNLPGVISGINRSLNNVTCRIDAKGGIMTTTSGKRVFITEGMLGVVQINTGYISMMKLFLNRIIKI